VFTLDEALYRPCDEVISGSFVPTYAVVRVQGCIKSFTTIVQKGKNVDEDGVVNF
jgi:hypothetical protein